LIGQETDMGRQAQMTHIEKIWSGHQNMTSDDSIQAKDKEQ
jgi:hypothetical protein